MRAVCHGSGLVLGLENLAEVVLRQYHRVLLIGRMQSRIAYIEQIGSQGQVRSMFLQNAKGQQACALGLLNSATKVRGSQFFPMGGEFGWRPQRRRTENQEEWDQQLAQRPLPGPRSSSPANRNPNGLNK